MTEEIAPVEDSGQAEINSSIQFNASAMPEGLRDEPSLQTFDSVDKLAKSYVNAVKMIGGDPNLTQNQADDLLTLFENLDENSQAEEGQAMEDLRVQTTVNLQKEWGKNYDGNLDYARRAYAQFGTAELTNAMDSSGFGNHPEVIKAFSKVGQLLGEEALAVGTGLGRNNMSPQTAQEEIQALYSDKEFSKAYRNNSDPQHKVAMNKMERLFKSAYPSQQRQR